MLRIDADNLALTGIINEGCCTSSSFDKKKPLLGNSKDPSTRFSLFYYHYI